MGEFGFNHIEAFQQTPADLERCIKGIAATGAKWVRLLAPWAQLQTNPGVYTWDGLDRAMNMIVAQGLKPLLLLAPFGGTVPFAKAPADFGMFARAAVQRYAIERGQSNTFEIMNEVNSFPHYGLGFCDPIGYTTYLRAASTEIRKIFPAAEILFAGMAPQGDGFGGLVSMDPVRFLRESYAAGAKGLFTAMSNHPYSITADFRYEAPTPTQYYMARDAALYKLMQDNGDGALKVWETEIGFPTASMSQQQQSNWLRDQYAILAARPHVGPIFVYNWRDSLDDKNNVENTLGVIDYRYTDKIARTEWVPTIRPAATAAATGSGIVRAGIGLRAAASGSGIATAITALAAAVVVAASGSGTTVGEIHGRPAPVITGSGSVSATATPGANRTAAATGSGTATAVVSTNAQRAVDITGSGSVTATVTQQKKYSYDFTNTGTFKPTALFTDFGRGYYVTSNTALNNNAVIDGVHYSGGIYKLDQLSADHFAEVRTAFNTAANSSGDRSIMPLCRASADGSSWVGATCHWGGVNSAQILMCVNGVITPVGVTSSAALLNDLTPLRISADGNTYTATRSGEVVASWHDEDGAYPGAANKRTGFGFQHIRSGGVDYGTGGISNLWRGEDLRPTAPPVAVTAAPTGNGSVAAAAGAGISGSAGGSGSAVASVIPGVTVVAACSSSGSVTAAIGARHTAAASGAGTAVGATQEQANRDATIAGEGTTTARPGARTTPTCSGTGTVSTAIAVPVTATASGAGSTTATRVPGSNATGTATGDGTATAAAAANLTVAAAGSGTTTATVEAKYAYTYTFSGNTKPTAQFTDFGDGGSSYNVAGGVANNSNGPSTNITYYCGGLYKSPLSSRQMAVDVTADNVAGSADRGIMAIANASSSAAGADWIGALGFGFAAAGKIVTKISGVYAERASLSAVGFGANDVLRIITTLDVGTGIYTYTAYKNGTAIGSWTDNGGLFTPGFYPGFGFKGIRSGAVYVAQGIYLSWNGRDN